jgi:pilus assembly protein CpaF
VLGTVGSAYDTVEAEVRELVRRRGLDPVEDRGAMRRLVDEVVLDYDDRALSSSLPPLADPGAAARAVYDAVAGFGPLQRHLDDPEVEEICINEPGRVFIARRGRSELTTTILSDNQVRDLVEKMLKTTGRRIDLSTPFVDAILSSQPRPFVVIPDIARAWSMGERTASTIRLLRQPRRALARASANDRLRYRPTTHGRLAGLRP